MLFKRLAQTSVLLIALATPAMADDAKEPFNEKWKKHVIGGNLFLMPQHRVSVGTETQVGLGFRTDLNLDNAYILSNEGTDVSASVGFSPEEGLTNLNLKLKGYHQNPLVTKRVFDLALGLGSHQIDTIVDQSEILYDQGTDRLELSRKLGVEGSAHFGKRKDVYSPAFKQFPYAADEEDYEGTEQLDYAIGAKGLFGVRDGEAMVAVLAELGAKLPDYTACIKSKKMVDHTNPAHSLCGTLALELGAGPALTTDGIGVAIRGRQALGLRYRHRDVFDRTRHGSNVVEYEVRPEFSIEEAFDPASNKSDARIMLNAGISWGAGERRPTGYADVVYDADGKPVN